MKEKSITGFILGSLIGTMMSFVFCELNINGLIKLAIVLFSLFIIWCIDFLSKRYIRK